MICLPPAGTLGWPSAMTTASATTPSKTLVFARRLGSTLLLWSIVGGVFWSRQSWAFLGLFTLLTLVATLEFFHMLARADVPCLPRFSVLLTAAYCGLLHAGLTAAKPVAQWELLMLCLALAGSFALQLRKGIHGLPTLLAVLATPAALLYLGVMFNHAAKLLFLLPDWHLPNGQIATPAALLILWLLAVTKFSDMGAYLTGSLIGKHKMIPKVSPAKTWEGFAGALAFSLLAGCSLYALFPQHLAILSSWPHVIALSLLLSILAVLGDLAESIIKRALAAKDSGAMLPGIGGALDLIDSICFTAPALYLYLSWSLPSA